MKWSSFGGGILALLCTSVLSAQPINVADVPHCIYTENNFSDPLYLYGGNPEVEAMATAICQAAGLEQNFTIAAANVPSVAVVRDESGDYLLYSLRYARQLLEKQPDLLYLVLAHEIGHLARDHSLSSAFRLREESAADEFMGRVAFEIPNFSSRAKLLFVSRQETFSHSYLYPNNLREKVIANGWDTAEGLVRSSEQLGYLENQHNRNSLPLPLFKIKGCPRYRIFSTSRLPGCQTVGDINHALCEALDGLGYEQRSYYAAPNGFALLTPVEQIDKRGNPLAGQERWQDYPSSGDFESLMEYLSALIMPRRGYFRLFAFLVSDQQVAKQSGELSSKAARAWLKEGGYRLPQSIQRLPLVEGHELTVLIYEFEAPASTQLLEERCEQFLSIQEHLQKSGIAGALK